MDNKLNTFIDEAVDEISACFSGTMLGMQGRVVEPSDAKVPKELKDEFELTVRTSLQPLHDAMLAEAQSLRDAPPPYPADKDNHLKHIYQNEGYAKALDAIIDKWKQ